MHNALNRLQTTFGFFTSCAFTLIGIISLLSIVPFPASTSSPQASIVARDVQIAKGIPQPYNRKPGELASIRFDLSADLSPLFTWNTKQLFVYVTANYPAKDGQMAESVIWDTIIPATATPWSLQTLRERYFPDEKMQRRARMEARRKQKDNKSKAISRPGLLSIRNQKPKYRISDPSGTMAGRANLTLQVSWNIQPWVGALIWDKGHLGARVGSWSTGDDGRSDAFDIPTINSRTTESARVQPVTPEAGTATPVVEL